jgi:hypothetical protein
MMSAVDRFVEWPTFCAYPSAQDAKRVVRRIERVPACPLFPLTAGVPPQSV